MKLQAFEADVIRNGTGSETEFTLEMGPKVFRMFSDSIYENKIGSVIRELSANAFDAHVRADASELPFEIHLPDALEPYLSIKDYGVGMDDNTVRNVYGCYLKSTKEDSNDEIGAFGLGGKTPFAYTDAYTLISRFDGVKRHYSCFINGKGKPSIVDTGVGPTDEPNGVEVIIAVTKEEDYATFGREVRDQLRFFHVKPTILNGSVDFVDYRSGTSGFMACNEVSVGGPGSPLTGVWIVQGVIGYPLDIRLISPKIKEENREFLEVIRSSAMLHFDLGEIEVTTSREGVSYTDYTIANIEKKLDLARENIKDAVQAKLDAYSTPWKLAIALEEDRTLRTLAKITDAVLPNLPTTYATSYDYHLDIDLRKLATFGIDVEEDEALAAEVEAEEEDEDFDPDYDDEEEEEEEEELTLPGVPATSKFYNLSQVRIVTYNASRKSRRAKYRWKRSANPATTMRPKNPTYIVFVDTIDKPKQRLDSYLESRLENNYRQPPQVFVIENRDGGPVDAVLRDKVIELLGQPTEYVMLSNIAKLVKSRGANGYRAATAYIYNIGDNVNDTSDWERVYSSVRKSPGYYVVMDRNSTSDFSGSGSIILKLAGMGLIDKPIYGLRTSEAEKYRGKPGWERVSDAGREIAKRLAADKTISNAYLLAQSLSNTDVGDSIAGKYYLHVLKEAFNAGEISRQSPLNKFFRLQATVAKLVQRGERRGLTSFAKEALGYAGLTVPQNYPERLAAVASEVTAHYPLLKLMNGGQWEKPSPEVQAHLVQYVKSVS